VASRKKGPPHAPAALPRSPSAGLHLRFGAATTDRQIEIYTRLVPALTAIRDEAGTQQAATTTPDRAVEDLKSAAKKVFRSIGWDQLEAHRKSQ
jgi:hypothetical protein